MNKWGSWCLPMVIVLLFGCSTRTDEPSFTNPFDPILGADLPVPDSIVVSIGNNLVRLEWSLPDGENADEFAIFRTRFDQDGTEEAERLVDRVTLQSFQDTQVRNGRFYEYRIAAGRNGQFGRRSEEVGARPGLYAIVISDDKPTTRNRVVSLTPSGPEAEAIQLSEDPDAFTAPWRSVTAGISWTLSTGDGSKTVYGRFRLRDGSETLPVSDTIRLDTKAVIRSVDFDGSTAKQPGDTIHFRLDAAEPRGSATIDVQGVFRSLALFDDGTNGDAVAEDGIYERTTVIPTGTVATNEVVLGAFVDEAGNQAADSTAPQTLSVTESPEMVSLLNPVLAEPPDPASVTLRWTQSLEAGFSAYRVFRSLGPTVDSTDRLIATITSRTALSFEDLDVVESQLYYYRVFVVTTSGAESGSNTIQVPIPNVRPPDPVVIQDSTAVSFTRATVEWNRSPDRDFLSYRLFRNETGAVSDTDLLVATINDLNQTFHDDTGLQENTTYYYRVYTDDQGGLSSRSNEVELTTLNGAPGAVILNSAASISSNAATLNWAESTAHGFFSYKLYRDTTPTVTTASTLVVEVHNSAVTSFRDTDLVGSTTYYYRVVVEDDRENPDPASTGSNTITFTTF